MSLIPLLSAIISRNCSYVLLLTSSFPFSSFPFPVSSFSLQGGAAGLRQQVSGSAENHPAAADWTSSALQQSGDGGAFKHRHRFTTRGQSWPTQTCWLQVKLYAIITIFGVPDLIKWFYLVWQSTLQSIGLDICPYFQVGLSGSQPVFLWQFHTV